MSINLEKIEKALSLTTSGPWLAFKSEIHPGQVSICSMGGEHAEDCPQKELYKSAHCHECVVYETHIINQHDADFIAMAPEYVAWLIHQVRLLSRGNE